jgi:phage shock protein A
MSPLTQTLTSLLEDEIRSREVSLDAAEEMLAERRTQAAELEAKIEATRHEIEEMRADLGERA